MGRVELKNVYKSYTKDKYVIEDFNLTVDDGEFCILLGPSGCGKSTILRMIAGLEEITEGEISINGKIVNDVSPKNRNIAMVFQSYALYPHFTVYQNIAYPLKIKKIPKEKQNTMVNEAAEILNIKHLLDRYPKQLSGGERQRVAIGRAIVRKPEVFLFDEPLSNLDAKLRNSMRSELKLLHKKLKTTFIYVTHDQIEAMTMATKIVVINHGKIQQISDPLNLYNNPENIFVASFIGNPPMNLFKIKKINNEFYFGNYKIDIGNNNDLDYSNLNEIIVGIRPEKLYFEKEKGEFSFKSKILVFEPIGKEFLYTLQLENMQNFSDNIFVNSEKIFENKDFENKDSENKNLENKKLENKNSEKIDVYFNKKDIKIYHPETGKLIKTFQ